MPYTLPNYVFVGDDTGSADADITLGEVILTANIPVALPVPSGLVLLLGGLLAMLRFATLRG